MLFYLLPQFLHFFTLALFLFSAILFHFICHLLRAYKIAHFFLLWLNFSIFSYFHMVLQVILLHSLAHFHRAWYIAYFLSYFFNLVLYHTYCGSFQESSFIPKLTSLKPAKLFVFLFTSPLIHFFILIVFPSGNLVSFHSSLT